QKSPSRDPHIPLSYPGPQAPGATMSLMVRTRADPMRFAPAMRPLLRDAAAGVGGHLWWVLVFGDAPDARVRRPDARVRSRAVSNAWTCGARCGWARSSEHWEHAVHSDSRGCCAHCYSG